MRRRGWREDTAPNNEVNMTPLIDVSLVLVVMLILATPLAFESRIDVRNAARTGRQAQDAKPSERVEIILVTDDTVRLNRNEMPREQLAATLGPLLQAGVDRGVFVGCEPGVSHGAFVDVLDQAKLGGATEIAVFER